ncbi:hypothetical protein Q604_UNBC11004G0001, partial [human gut metagenome]
EVYATDKVGDEMPRISKRQLILESAAAIINEKGADYLTLDAVAQRAGISKGGLFYHFKSKDELIKELVNYAHKRHRSLQCFFL